MKRTNQVTEYISNTDSISFLASFGYKVLGMTRGNTRDMDKFTIRNENKAHTKPRTLRRKDFWQFINNRYRKSVIVVKIDDKAPTDACIDYDLFHYGV